MKNFELLAAVNGGILNLKSTGLSSNTAWRTFQLRKALNAALEKYQSDIKGILTEVGIEDDVAFDKLLDELKKKENRGEEENKKLAEMESKLRLYNEFIIKLIKEDVDFTGLKPLPYAEWRKLVDLNTDSEGKSSLGFNMFYLFGQPNSNVDVETALEGIAWYAPEEEEDK
jgi:hypothetical protein